MNLFGKKDEQKQQESRVGIFTHRLTDLFDRLNATNYEVFNGDPVQARTCINSCVTTIIEHHKGLAKKGANDIMAEKITEYGDQAAIDTMSAIQRNCNDEVDLNRRIAKNGIMQLNNICEQVGAAKFLDVEHVSDRDLDIYANAVTSDIVTHEKQILEMEKEATTLEQKAPKLSREIEKMENSETYQMSSFVSNRTPSTTGDE